MMLLTPEEHFGFGLLTKTEDLHPDLVPYFETGTTMDMIRHPLIFSVPHSKNLNAFINYQYLIKKEVADKYLADGAYNFYIFLHETPYHFLAFDEVNEFLSNKEYWEILSTIWQHSENIWQNLEGWKTFFASKRKSKHYFMDKNERKIFKALPSTVTCYRGYVPNENEHGLSYSLSEEKAVWFAKRYSKPGKVKELKVKKEMIFAFLNGRGENEIIIL